MAFLPNLCIPTVSNKSFEVEKKCDLTKERKSFYGGAAFVKPQPQVTDCRFEHGITVSLLAEKPSRQKSVERVKKALLMTAVKTPFLSNGEIDIDTYDKLLERQIQDGVDGVIVAGTTGEGHLMAESELLSLIGHVATKFGDRLVVVGNTGSNNTSKGLKATKEGFARGMDAALQINPYYGKTSEAGVLRHLQLLLDQGPGIVYNVAGRTGQDMKPSLLLKLKASEGFMGIKECSGNDRIAEYKKEGVQCWSGNDDQAFEGRVASGSGVISVASNLVPSLMRRLMDDPTASDLNASLQDLINWLFCEPNPIAIDTVLAMTGVVKPIFRLPYVPLNAQQRQKGLDLLSKVPASAVVGTQRRVMDDSEFVLLDHY